MNKKANILSLLLTLILLVNCSFGAIFNNEVRSQIFNQFKEIKNEIGEDPKAFVSILLDVLVSVATNKSSEELKATIDSNTDMGKRTHVATSATGNVIITVMSGAALIKNMPEIGDKLTEWVKKISKSRNEIRKILTTDAGKVYLEKYFNKFVKEGSFNEWFEKAKDFKLGQNLNFEAHHVIPVGVLENSKELERILNKFGFDFNGIDNAIPLQKKSLKFDVNGHANHPKYDEFVKSEINKITTGKDLTDIEKFEKIQELLNKAKDKLEMDVLLGNKNVNEIISW